MNRPPNCYKQQCALINACANMLSGLGYHGLATQLWGVEAELREKGKPGW